jgi:hypothetical protein
MLASGSVSIDVLRNKSLRLFEDLSGRLQRIITLNKKASAVVLLCLCTWPFLSKKQRRGILEIWRSSFFALTSRTVKMILAASLLVTGAALRYGLIKQRTKTVFPIFFGTLWMLYYRFRVIEHARAHYQPTFFNVHIVEKAALTRTTFAPVPWAYNKHAQTVLCLALSAVEWVFRKLSVTRETIIGFDDSPQYIDWLYFGSAGRALYQRKELPILLLIHGLGDDNNHPYMQRFAYMCQRHGWRACAFTYWRCDFGETRDLAEVINHLHESNPRAPIIPVAWSAGGNILLKYLGQAGKDTPVVAAIALSGCFDFLQAVKDIRKNENQSYHFFLTMQVLSSSPQPILTTTFTLSSATPPSC